MKVFGVSMDDAESHKSFIADNDLPFPLASRQSVLIAADGRIKKIWRKVSPAEHAAEVMAAAREK